MLSRSVKGVARFLASVVVLPSVLMYHLQKPIIGKDRAFFSQSQLLSLVPGISGQLLRNALLRWIVDYCHPSVVIEFGSIFSKTTLRLEKNVYIGPYCQIGMVHVEEEVLIASGVQIPSGGMTHGTDDLNVPVRNQPGRLKQVRIGTNSWIGAGAVVLEDVGARCVIAAGAVVAKQLRDEVVAGGVPAKVLKDRAAPVSEAS